MATTVNSITTPSGQACDGAITFVSQSPSQLAINNNPTSPYTINFSPLSANVNSLNGKAGTVSLVSQDGGLSFTTSPINSQIKVNAYNATTNSSGLVAQNITGALAWAGAGGPPEVSTVAYVVGAVVIYSGTTYLCLTPQPIGSSIPTSDGINWQSIGGGGAAGSSITAGSGATSATVACDVTGGVTTTSLFVSENISGNFQSLVGGFIVIQAGDGGFNVSTGDNGVQLTAEGAIMGNLKIGGDPLSPNTGLYVTETLLEYNGANLLAPQTQIANGNAPTNGTVSIDSTGAITLTSAGNITTNCVDVVLNASNNVAIEPTQFLLCQTTGTNPAQLKVGGTPTATGLYVSNTQLLYNNVPVGSSSGGSSITGTSGSQTATVSCATGSVIATSTGSTSGIKMSGATFVQLDCGLAQGSLIVRPTGAINLTASDAAGTVNNITLQTALPGGGSSGGTLGNISLESGGAINGSATGVISLSSSDSTNAGRITIGGPINDVGLYIGNNEFVYFNNRIFPGQQTFFQSPYNWSSTVTYYPNDIVTYSDGYNYICQVQNSNSNPTSANPNWRALAVNPAVATPTIQTGLNVPGYTTTAGVLVNSASSQILIRFLPPAGASLTFGGGTTTFTGTITIDCATTKFGSVNWVGVQMWDTATAGAGGNVAGSNSSNSFSTSVYFPTAIPILDSDSFNEYISPLITASIITTPGTSATPTTPTNYSIGMLVTGVGVSWAAGTDWTVYMSGSVETVFALVDGGTF